jgi:pyruvate dehydrogenase E2 component (dihydrolipoamide acetyltransferase)
MPIKVLMPALSPTMTEGKLASWKKAEGEKVKSGDVIAEIETDKATMEVEAVDEGTLGKILVPAGTEGVKVNEPIALILEEGEDKSALAAAGNGSARAAKAEQPVAASAQPKQPERMPVAAVETAPGGGARPSGAEAGGSAAGAHRLAPAGATAHEQAGRIFASPLARRMAEQAGLDLSRITGSGPQGRIIKVDIESALSQRGGKPVAARAPSAPGPAPVQAPPAPAASIADGTPYKLVPHTTMRKVIARRLTESKQQVPHFYLTVDCEIDALLKARAEINAKSPEKGDGAYKLSVNDFVIKAAAVALRRVPAANASWSDEGTLMYEAVDISVAVAIPNGLITPIIRNADQKGLAQISKEMKDLAERARANKLKPEEFQGGTFSISNLGMYGIKDFAAVINPPQGCILAVGVGEQRPVVKNGALAIATIMSCTLSVDHRVVDGAVGAEYIAAFKSIVENPMMLLL